MHQLIAYARTIVAVAALTAATTAPAAAAQDPQVELKTSMGVIVVELYPDKAPKSVANFLQYVKEGYYDGTIFHRVIPGFMVQGGGFTPDMNQKPAHAPIPIESNNGLKNDTGWLAMARTPNPNSATSQFFINVNNNNFLNYPGQDGYGYTVFGKVVKGMDVVNKIVGVPTGMRGPHGDVPQQSIVIEKATLLGAKPAAKKE